MTAGWGIWARLGRYRQQRHARHQVGEVLRHAAHVRNMREDVAPRAALSELDEAVATLRNALRQDAGLEALQAGSDRVLACAQACGYRRVVGWAENVEVLVVAFAVAMCCRTYFLQPFKIPTGSMQPTLNGIRYEALDRVDPTHRMPLKLVRWALTGDWHVTRRARGDGVVSVHGDVVVAGGHRYAISPDLALHVRNGQVVSRGEVLASGVRRSGDHLFVNKVAWHFREPRRGDVIVFRTDDIPELHDKKTHYIKRLVGLPGETLQIVPPILYVDGKPCDGPEPILDIMAQRNGYAGYQNSLRRPEDPLGVAASVFRLQEKRYFACGDNTRSSFDSRFWGPVPERNLVGPALAVYWPFGAHWGRIR